MQRLLLLSLYLYFPSLTFAQLSPFDQNLYREWFDMVAYDSIASSTDSGSAFVPYEVISQDYYFQNNTKISTAKWYNPNGQYAQSSGAWHTNYSNLYRYSLIAPFDTIEKETFYWDKWNRDSAYESIVNYGLPFESHEITFFSYHSNNKIHKKITQDVKTSDTVGVENYYYSSGGELDSVVFWDERGIKVLKMYFQRSTRIESVFVLGDLPPTPGFDTLSSYLPIYNSAGQVDEIKQLNYAFVSSPELMNVLRFYKKPNSTIEIEEVTIENSEVYPNPVTDWFELKVESQDNELGKLRIFDTSGKMYTLQMVAKQGILRVDSTPLPSGFYIGKYTTSPGKVIEFKFVK